MCCACSGQEDMSSALAGRARAAMTRVIEIAIVRDMGVSFQRSTAYGLGVARRSMAPGAMLTASPHRASRAIYNSALRVTILSAIIAANASKPTPFRSEEHTSELQSH